MGTGRRLAGLLCLAASVATVHAQYREYREGDTVCELDGDSNACAFKDLSPSELDGSTLIYPGGDTRCAFDDFSNASVSFATNSTYFFQVFPNTEGDRSKLLLYFQGGGACIDDVTCSFGLQCVVETFTPNARALSVGIANRTDPNNMFKDWNLVHIPYCTGDLHVGNHTEAIADDPLLSLLDTPDCLGHNMTIHQVGYTNTMAVLDWAYANFPSPSSIVIGGSSAGSLAAQLLSSLVAEKWQTEKSGIRYSVLADSYVSVLPASHPAGKSLEYYGACDVDLNFPPSILGECSSGNLTTVEMTTALIDEIPTTEWLFVNSEGDYTQRYYYALLEEGILGYPFDDDLMSEAAFFSNMTAILDAYKAASDKVSTFYATGDQHVFLTVGDFYHNATNDSTGEFLGSVINRWLEANASIDGTSGSSSSSAGSVGASGSTETGAASTRSAAASVVALALVAALLV